MTDGDGIPPSLATKADHKVESAQLVDVAHSIAGIWDEVAAHLSPELFSIVKVKEIERDYRSAFSQARAMLEMWSKAYGSKATCRLLIQKLCKMGQRSAAAEAFSSELVDFVEPLLI